MPIWVHNYSHVRTGASSPRRTEANRPGPRYVARIALGRMSTPTRDKGPDAAPRRACVLEVECPSGDVRFLLTEG